MIRLPRPVRAARERLAPVLRTPPGFLVVGAQKAGTTSLHHYLGAHPDLRPASGPKELHFFDLHHARGMAWYMSHFPARLPPDRRIPFETTPAYLRHPDVPERIRRALGRVRLIAVLREPAARAHSAWKMWHNFATIRPEEADKADPRPFSQAIAEELAGNEQSGGRRRDYVSAGHYAEQLRRYRAHFPAKDMLVLDYAELGADPHRFLDRICDFLGVTRFPADQVAEMTGTRLWSSPPTPPSDATRATLDILRTHYAPWNEALFDMLGERWDWNPV